MNVVKPSPSSHETTLPSGGRRGVVIVIGLLFAVHSALVTIWVMPPNPFRDAITQETLQGYIENPVMPVEQSWSVFAPTPRRGGESIKVRAYLGEAGAKGSRVTEWYDITADEDQRIKYLVNPSRFHSATRRLGGNINSALASLTPAQEKAIAANFITTPRSKLRKALLQLNTQGPAGQAAVDKYLENDEMLTRYGTMYATARWGEGVTAVEFLVGHRTVPNYSVRNKIDFLDVPFTLVPIGVRAAISGSADAQAAFDGYVAKDSGSGSTKKGAER